MWLTENYSLDSNDDLSQGYWNISHYNQQHYWTMTLQDSLNAGFQLFLELCLDPSIHLPQWAPLTYHPIFRCVCTWQRLQRLVWWILLVQLDHQDNQIFHHLLHQDFQYTDQAQCFLIQLGLWTSEL